MRHALLLLALQVLALPRIRRFCVGISTEWELNLVVQVHVQIVNLLLVGRRGRPVRLITSHIGPDYVGGLLGFGDNSHFLVPGVVILRAPFRHGSGRPPGRAGYWRLLPSLILIERRVQVSIQILRGCQDLWLGGLSEPQPTTLRTAPARFEYAGIRGLESVLLQLW